MLGEEVAVQLERGRDVGRLLHVDADEDPVLAGAREDAREVPGAEGLVDVEAELGELERDGGAGLVQRRARHEAVGGAAGEPPPQQPVPNALPLAEYRSAARNTSQSARARAAASHRSATLKRDRTG